VAPALDRQIAEVAEHRRRATSDFGVWKLPEARNITPGPRARRPPRAARRTRSISKAWTSCAASRARWTR
jgi:hypothetical protein